MARLLALYHTFAARVDTTGSRWSTEMVDPGAPTSPDRLVLCHNDVCLENVVFRDGVAVALLDFDFGLDQAGPTELLTILDDRIARGGEWVRAKVEEGHPGFLAMWASIGGQERFDRRRRWWASTRPRFASALG